MTVKNTEGVVSRSGGPALYQFTAAPEDARAIVAIVHGYADHGKRYAAVQEAWAKKGIGSIAIDLRGHGRAEGTRGYCDRFDQFVDDVDELTKLVNQTFPNKPAFLFGHSFGGLVTPTLLRRSPGQYRGLLLSNPYFKLALQVPFVKVLAGKIASRIVPKFGIPTGLGGEALTHDKKLAAAYDKDPLVFKNATARWFTETVKAQAAALANASKLTLPLYVALGTGDPVVDCAGGRAFYESASSKDKTKREYEGLLHEILNEPEWPSIADAMAEWVLERA